ncbi:MAG: aryl-sulfate sulfotransferase [Bacteroidia bacterium]|nr:aryl-sulfate sulfotransferase [Bacteroidia bacterium]
MIRFFLFLFSVVFIPLAESQHETGLIFKKEGSQKGYVLFAPLHSKTTYLIDKCGKVVHTWKSNYPPAQSVYLLPNGDLLRTANDSNKTFKGSGGGIELFDWNSNLKWSYKISNALEVQHHDICPLPNGNILVLVWEKKSRAQAIEMGRDPNILGDFVWSEKIVELKPKGKAGAELVWQWNLWDHMIQEFDSTKKNYQVVSQHPEKVDINYYRFDDPDWFHFNSIVYNSELDQILVSNRNYSEIFIIDHSTTTLQAAGHNEGRYGQGGDLLFRYGNPRTWHHGDEKDQVLFGQHYPHWISKGLKDEGKILVFNNGYGRRSNNYSSLDLILPEISNQKYDINKSSYQRLYSEKEQQVAGGTFFSMNVSSVQRLSSGNLLVCSGSTGRFCELNENNEVVWLYINPVSKNGISKRKQEPELNQVFRCTFFPPDYPAFRKRKLVALKEIELESNYNCDADN